MDCLGHGSVGRPSPRGAIGWNPGIPAPAGLKIVAPSLIVDEISDYTNNYESIALETPGKKNYTLLTPGVTVAEIQ